MLKFALYVICLFPLVIPIPEAPSRSWKVKDGLIIDSLGQEVGIFGLDKTTTRLLR